MKDLAAIDIDQTGFETLARMCVHDGAFPRTWEAWQRLLAEAKEQAANAGFDYPGLKLDIEAFSRWCLHLQIIPCLEALRAFAIVKRAPVFQVPDAGG